MVEIRIGDFVSGYPAGGHSGPLTYGLVVYCAKYRATYLAQIMDRTDQKITVTVKAKVG